MKEFNRKSNKIWVDKGSEFYKNSFKKWLKDNNIEMYSIHNKGKSDFAERFIRTLKNKIFKHMTAILKNVYFDVLDEVFVVSKIKNAVPWTYVINDLNGEKITGTFYEKELQKTNQKEFRIEK